jgi:hypothetical protein
MSARPDYHVHRTKGTVHRPIEFLAFDGRMRQVKSHREQRLNSTARYRDGDCLRASFRLLIRLEAYRNTFSQRVPWVAEAAKERRGSGGGFESAAHAARSPVSRSEVDSRCTRTGPAAAERCGASVLAVNLSAGRTCSWSAIDGSRTPARDCRRDGLCTFACAAALDRSATSAASARAPQRRPFAGAATAFDGAWTSPPEQPA